ncbi:uncharacterized protein LOC118995118, partial [Sturnira hondurensis]|uniref:uncharacterized protein LOC118995118 n=1 Tax=Sturnira hondurensis TaxID=192404 RepID=UPI00187AE1F9
MLSASSLVLVIFLMLGGTSGDSVNQTEGPVTLPEGKTLILNCTYQTTYTTTEYLFWYIQYQNKAPVLLLKSSSDNQEVHNRGFQAKLVKSEKSFHLQRPSVQMSDSAVYFCALSGTVWESTGGAEHKPRGAHTVLQGSSLAILFWESLGASLAVLRRHTGGTNGDSVNQTEGPVTLPEGKTLILNCTYQTTYTTEYLFWYVQYQNKEPVLLLKSFLDSQEVHNRGFQAKLVKTEKSFHLQRPSVQMSDSAVYFCA